MPTLYHHWLSPGSRKLRVVLAEKALAFDSVIEKVWERRPEFLALNPAGGVPVLVLDDGAVLADDVAVAEYLDEVHPEPPLIGAEPLARAEVRRVCGRFDRGFERDVTDNLVGQKVLSRCFGLGGPDSRAVRAGYDSIRRYMAWLDRLADARRWLAGERFSLADIAAAAQLSVVDYIGDVPWEDFPAAKLWYARMKSRPSLRPLLADRFPGLDPPAHYDDPDF